MSTTDAQNVYDMVDGWGGVATRKHPGFWVKAFFWLIVATYSVFFAEVLSGSFIFPFFNVWGYLVLLPLYGIHALLLFTLVVRWGNRSFESLFSVGLLFGLYEAFITKVIFSPPDGRSPFFFLEVDWLQVSVLVLWWHMFMAFIIPVLLAVTALTRKNDISGWLPRPVKMLLADKKRSFWAIIAFLVWAGAFMGGNTDPVSGPLAAASGLAIIYALSWLWKKRTGNAFTIEQLLPDKKEFFILLGFLVVWCYLLLGSAFGSKGLPGITGHAVIMIVYALCLLLIMLKLRKPSEEMAPAGPLVELPPIDLKALVIMVLVLGASISISSVTGLGWYVIIFSFLGGSLLGLVCLAAAILSVVRAYLFPRT